MIKYILKIVCQCGYICSPATLNVTVLPVYITASVPDTITYGNSVQWPTSFYYLDLVNCPLNVSVYNQTSLVKIPHLTNDSRNPTRTQSRCPSSNKHRQRSEKLSFRKSGFNSEEVSEYADDHQ